jgi:hypothetical protein
VPKLCVYGGSREIFSGGFSEQDLEGTRNPQGGAAEAEERAAAGRMKSPDAVPEQRRDTENGGDVPEQSSHLHTGCEVQYKCSLFRAGMCATRTTDFAPILASLQLPVRGHSKEQQLVGIASRIVITKGHG